LALAGSARFHLPQSATAFVDRARAFLADRGDRTLAQRVAGNAFLIRVFAAGLAYITQVLLARWMGAHEFGVYVYVWTWVMLLGALVDLGIASAAQRFIPEYARQGAFAHLRGFLSGSRWLAFGIASVLAATSALFVVGFRGFIDDYLLIPLLLAFVCLPLYGVLHVQDGIARSYNWINLALLPPYVLRQVVVIVMMGGAYALGFATDAVTATAVASFSIWITALGQMVLLNRRLKVEMGPGEKRYEPKTWIAVALPMFMVDSLYSMLTYVDVIVLQQFRDPQDIAIYYAAMKTLSLVAFVYFAVSAAVAHRFAEYRVSGDRERLKAFVADSIRWTFWPSLAATIVVLALGWPLLWLFGRDFTQGYGLMFVFAMGLLIRAAVGPGERFLNMLGAQRACAFAAGAAFIVNLVLCYALIPSFGLVGAAVSTTIAFAFESALIFNAAKKKFGIHLFIV
jgi:O-antigen/teichoic acid export membrane protein